MALETGRNDDAPPRINFTIPLFNLKSRDAPISKPSPGSDKKRHDVPPGPSFASASRSKHARLEEPTYNQSRPSSSGSDIYYGSYDRHRTRSRLSTDRSASTKRYRDVSPRASMNEIQLEHILGNVNLNLETYGVEEFRDGFFDASFFKPRKQSEGDLLRAAERSLPDPFFQSRPSSVTDFLRRQGQDLQDLLWQILTTRAGVKLLKSFLGFYIAYILCLIPSVYDWLGPYGHVMVLSTIINHPGRTVGAQLDGLILTSVGTTLGLMWAALALFVCNSTPVAVQGYGGIMSVFLILFVGLIAWLRAYVVRSYQMVLTAGMALLYACLASTDDHVSLSVLKEWEVPWLFGQAICFVVCCTVFPDGGARPLAVALHDAFSTMHAGLSLPHGQSTAVQKKLAWTFVNLSQAYRDLTLDLSITRFTPKDVKALRNALQAVIRSLQSIQSAPDLYGDFKNACRPEDRTDVLEEHIIDFEPPSSQQSGGDSLDREATKVLMNKIAQPTLELLSCMKQCLATCDAVLLGISGYRKYLGPPAEVSSDVVTSLDRLREAVEQFDTEDEGLIDDPSMPSTFSNHPRLVEVFLFLSPIRQAATTIESLLIAVVQMQQRHRSWSIHMPCYGFEKSLQRTNAQVRHDRGGVTAAFFMRSSQQLKAAVFAMQNNSYRPAPTSSGMTDTLLKQMPTHEDEDEVIMDEIPSSQKKFRYRLWLLLRRLQDFETRYAFKVVVVVVLLSLPAWLQQSREWYIQYESWWAVLFVWIMMHPRVGGNLQDVITRCLTAILGAAWGGLACGARNGNPFVIAVFALIFMIPMIHRFTQGDHPRSGLLGCLSFTIVSLTAYRDQDSLNITKTAWTRGIAFIVGIIVSVVINWVFWPFVARHELRKALATMMLTLAVMYRATVAQYIYYGEGEEPTEAVIDASELLEGRVRENFVRLRQLMALTRHEIRLRAPFNPLPYSALIENCGFLFEHLVEVRQSSLFFHPNYLSDDTRTAQDLLPYRRDAVAAILMNLYILAGALRANRKVPRYLPSAAAARKRLLDRMAELEATTTRATDRSNLVPRCGIGRRFAEIYQYAYSSALTDIVVELVEIQKYTKLVCGEFGFDEDDLAD